MREIKFKAKRKNDNQWVEGFYYEHGKPLQCFGDPKENKIDKFCILRTGFADWNMPRTLEVIEILPETVCEYIGISDMNEKPQELFTDDVVEVTIFDNLQPEKIISQQRRKINFKDGLFGIQWTRTDFLSLKHHFASNCKIIKIGNIWDNPELLESEDNQ